MTEETLKKANYINQEIETLEAEVKELCFLSIVKEGRLRRLLERPKEKTYKKLYCIANIDSIESAIILREDEIKVLIGYKHEKIRSLREQLEGL